MSNTNLSNEKEFILNYINSLNENELHLLFNFFQKLKNEWSLSDKGLTKLTYLLSEQILSEDWNSVNDARWDELK